MKSRLWPYLSISTGMLFIILLVALHFLEPEFDPSLHQISEYELGRYGWVMSIAFFSLGASVLSMLISTWSSISSKKGLVGRWWFLAISLLPSLAQVFFILTIPPPLLLISMESAAFLSS